MKIQESSLRATFDDIFTYSARFESKKPEGVVNLLQPLSGIDRTLLRDARIKSIIYWLFFSRDERRTQRNVSGAAFFDRKTYMDNDCQNLGHFEPRNSPPYPRFDFYSFLFFSNYWFHSKVPNFEEVDGKMQSRQLIYSNYSK